MYAEDKKIDEFISSKIDKFEFSKGKDTKTILI